MRPERSITVAFVVSMLASMGLVAVYLSGGDNQLEGILLALSLGSLGIGFVMWARRLLAGPDETEERERLASDAAARAEQPETREVTRRTLLVRLLAGAGGALAAALAIPTLSLGPRPGQSLFETAWRRGTRVVDGAGNPVKPTDISPDNVITVFPEGEVGSADAQAVLVRVDPELLRLPEGRGDWAPAGTLAYSKICTHAGCPVGLYRTEARELLCPCHQSTFDVTRGAMPVFGPAARALPQLPLDVDDEGFLIARGDFSEPASPSFWNMTD